MDRRNLLKQLLLGVTGGVFMPTWMNSCKKEDLIHNDSFNGTVLIIGAGAAGIYAAELLAKYGINFTILEADTRAGGRIRSDDSFADIPVELGADSFKGKRNVFYELASFVSPDQIVESSKKELFLLDGILRDEYFLKNNANLSGAGATFFDILESFASYPGGEITADNYLKTFNLINNQGLNLNFYERFKNNFNSVAGNEFGSDSNSVGMPALKEVESLASSGKIKSFLRKESLWSIFQKAFPETLNKVQYQKKITSIDYSGKNVVATTDKGETFYADKVLLTVSLGILKNKKIDFKPEIPAYKVSAISSIGFGQTIKVILQFKSPFWAAGSEFVYGGSVVPSYTFSSLKSTNGYFVSCLISGSAANKLNTLTDPEIINVILQELEQLFPTGMVKSKFNQKFTLMNWEKNPLFLGGSSFPSSGSQGKRMDLATPIADKIFFAGEATNYNGHCGTVHGAMESAYRAVEEILNK